ncbi:MAG: adenylate kinase [Clostridia bacterium]
MKIILLGAPGSGKGTQAENISRDLNIPTISTGNCLREAVKNKTEIGIFAKSFMDSGNLVPNDVVIGIIKERLKCEDCQNGFILDGFPRNVPQAIALQDMGIIIDKVICLEINDETIVKRMSGRRSCLKCGASYHTEYKPSKDNITCDLCGDALVVREDDKPETVLSRLEVFHKETQPLIDYYNSKNILSVVKGQEKISDTTALVEKVLKS